MTVFKRDGSEFWWIEFQYKGERYRRSSESTSKRKAEELERKWREELRATALLGKIPELAWGDAVDRYFKTVIEPRGNEGAAKRDLYVLNSLKAELGAATLISTLTAPVIVEYRDRLLGAGKAPATANRYLATIKAILRKAHIEWGALAVLPSFKLLKLNNERYRWLTDEEEDRLLIHSPVHLRDLCTFLIDTGARLSEATTLTWANVDMERHPRPLVKFMDTKSGKPRSVPLTKRVEDMFRRLHACKPEREDRVFLYRPLGNDRLREVTNGTKVTPFRNPHGAWYKATSDARLDDLNLHDLRHTFASRLVMRGVPLLTVSKLLGHATIQMTMRYAHLAPDAFDAAIGALERSRVTDSLIMRVEEQ